ncbi:MAG: ATP-binding cassette domain-containing protein, partial [Oscillospiraceae bacterium]|nr:ATP-binding cassette domain-containing protein [Oscillospiraceae bacterium]
MNPILQINNISYTYSDDTPFRHEALHDVSFSLERGEFLGVIGRTGSGKSTLIQHLNGLLKPCSGTVLFDGKDIWSDKQFTRSIRFRVGLVFQYPEYQLFEETVYDDIAF